MKWAFWPFDHRLRIINEQIKPGYAALKAARPLGSSHPGMACTPVPTMLAGAGGDVALGPTSRPVVHRQPAPTRSSRGVSGSAGRNTRRRLDGSGRAVLPRAGVPAQAVLRRPVDRIDTARPRPSASRPAGAPPPLVEPVDRSSVRPAGAGRPGHLGLVGRASTRLSPAPASNARRNEHRMPAPRDTGSSLRARPAPRRHARRCRRPGRRASPRSPPTGARTSSVWAADGQRRREGRRPGPGSWPPTPAAPHPDASRPRQDRRPPRPAPASPRPAPP